MIEAQTIRKHKEGILTAIRLDVNNARHEGLNRRVRLIMNRAYGFRSSNAAHALIMVTLGPITHVPPHEHSPVSDVYINPHLCQEAQKSHHGAVTRQALTAVD